MVNILDVIAQLKTDLWSKYGNVLDEKYTQQEIHMTYYLSTLMERSGHGISIDYKYTEQAAQAAFIAGLRIGGMDAEERANTIVASRIEDAISALRGEHDV